MRVEMEITNINIEDILRIEIEREGEQGKGRAPMDRSLRMRPVASIILPGSLLLTMATKVFISWS